MEGDAGVRLPELRVDGGAAANDWLMQFQADVLGRPVERPDVVETTALGAAALAGLALGVWRSVEEYVGARRFTRFTPAMAAAERERKLEEWRRAIGAALAWARGS
jgi:glycerol kinase